MNALARVASLIACLTLMLTLGGCAGSSANEPRADSGGDGGLGIPDGTCNKKAIGALIGGAIGGVVGSQVGDGAGRRIAILAGTAAGALIGSQVGRKMDEADRACVGEALEKARDNSTVAWASSDGSTTYRVTPLAPTAPQTDPTCRMFELQSATAAGSTTSKAQACRDPDGSWRVIE
jgi:surface antigen